MDVLVVGSGGREHTLCWKIAQSELVDKVYCAPGNAGTGLVAENADIPVMDITALADFAEDNKIGFTVVGPEAPLVAGICDEFKKRELGVFGASKKAARIEGSKSFSKGLMQKYNIPTAGAETFTDAEKAIEFAIENHFFVVKASGLAAGKGVFVCDTIGQVREAVNKVLVEKIFGEEGNEVLIEKKLAGEEASFLAFTDGETIVPMAGSQDHKRIFDGDKGPNTGGMGAYSPAPVITPALQERIMKEVMRPTIDGLAAEGAPYQGVLYAGLMIDGNDINVIEFNARFGDPETQVVVPRLESDIIPIMRACMDGTLGKAEVKWKKEAATCVVIAAGGYPGSYEKGTPINGLEAAAEVPNAVVFHAGTSKNGNDIVASGGRVLGVTALGGTVRKSIETAYAAVSRISFEGMQFRKDIGKRALERGL